MKKKLLLLSLIVLGIILYPKETYAFSSEDYKNKSLCGTYEVAGMHADGVIDPVACFSVFEDAQAWMKNNGAEDLVIFHRLNGKTVILDANMALVDLSVHSGTLNFYTTKESSDAYTYMNNESTYGGGDGAFIEAAYSNLRQIFMAKVKIANFTGWIAVDNYEIVPITWVKSSSSYTVTEESIRHNYVTRVQDSYSGNAGSTIGPKPDMLSTGTYYSYDGHFFYKDRKTMLKDYKNNTHNNAVNKNDEYYNYYMYLSNHTRTNYSSQNIDEYIRNNMGYYRDVFGNSASSGASRLYGKGQFFYYVQEKYGANAVLALSLSRNETGNGRSNLAINNNNGFGLNAVDSNPNNGKSWYPSFTYSIAKYGSHWITHKYADVKEWQYFGPQFGNKGIGMNVKYASDPYWSEKMAANYYSLDKSKGLQDYNYYQLGVLKQGAVIARSDASNSAKEVYKYPEAEDAVVIVGEKEGETVNGDATWYEVVSDLNLDSNYNEKGEGEAYNWDMTVYVPAAYIKKINKGKNGYVSPNSVTKYQDSEYEYDLYVEEADVKPKVAKSVKETSFYYDSALTTKKDQKLVNNRYVMVYSAAYDKNGVAVSYLVTSDYWHDQKEWVPANSITFVTSDYGKFSVTASGNQYTWVNSNTQDIEATKISGQYHNSYAPILEEKVVDGQTWYRVPVDISGTTDEFGWTLASAPNVYVEKRNAKAENTAPIITASNKTIVQGTKFDYKAGVTATDNEDGPLTDKIEVVEETVKIDVVGSYQVTYKVTDKNNATTTKTITVTVTENKKPVINAEDKEVIQYRELNELDGVSATDEEDGKVEVKVKNSTVKLDTPGDYEITYQATDTYNQTTEKTIKVTVIKDEAPVINAEDKTITQGTKFKPLEGVTAEDKEEGEIKDIEVVKNDVNEKVIDTYEVTYKAVDSYKNETTKTIKVTVVENQKPVINAEDKTIYLNEKFNPLEGVTAEDPEDGEIKDIEVVQNDVKTNEPGAYKVIYRVEDTFGNVVEKEITVTVKEKKLEEKEGTFYFHYLKENKNQLLMQGYQTITGIDNNLDTEINYKIILENIDTGTQTEIEATRITKKEDIPKAVYSPDGKDYTYSWFDAEINVNELENGNYKMYMEAYTDEYYSKSIINNKTYNEQATKVEGTKHSAIISNNFSSQISFVELKVRDELLAEKTSSYIYNQYDKYTEFNFTEDNKLHLRGNSYSYGADLSKNQKVTRKILFENVENYKLYTKDLGSITTGNYNVVLPKNDNLDKTRAWYDNNIDISDIEKGRYVIYITTSSNITDIAEMTEKLGRSLKDVTATIDGKQYSFTINKERGNRIEMIVE